MLSQNCNVGNSEEEACDENLTERNLQISMVQESFEDEEWDYDDSLLDMSKIKPSKTLDVEVSNANDDEVMYRRLTSEDIRRFLGLSSNIHYTRIRIEKT